MMNDLNQSLHNREYYRVMEKRIRYYANKYDPHRILYEPPSVLENNSHAEKRNKGISTLREIFTNIF